MREIAGLGIEFRTSNEVQSSVISETLPRLTPFAGPVSIVLDWRSEPLVLPDGSDFIDSHHREYVEHDKGIALRSGSLAAIAGDGTILVGGFDAEYEQLSDDFQRILSPLITHTLGRLGIYPIHAAAVARAGRALLLVGRPGSGKSSAAWAARTAGFEMLGDDTVFVRRGDDGFQVCGMRKEVVLPAEVLDRIPDGASRFAGDGGRRDRWELPPTMLRSGWHPLCGTIVAAHGSRADGSLDDVDRSALLSLLVGTYYSSDHPVELRRWFPRAAELCRLPAWSLLHSTDTGRRLDVAATLLDRAHRFTMIADPAIVGEG